MEKIVFCKKLQKEALGLAHKVYPGELGDKIMANISQEAWSMWLNHQTMLINEYRLNPLDQSARQYIEQQMQDFLFEGN